MLQKTVIKYVRKGVRRHEYLARAASVGRCHGTQRLYRPEGGIAHARAYLRGGKGRAVYIEKLGLRAEREVAAPHAERIYIHSFQKARRGVTERRSKVRKLILRKKRKGTLMPAEEQIGMPAVKGLRKLVFALEGARHDPKLTAGDIELLG